LELSSTTKIGGKTMRQSLREMVKDKGYQALPKESADDLGELSPRIKAVQRLVRAYRRKGRYEMLEEFPELKDSIYTLQQEKSQYRLIQ
jgi:SOS-response transcriptional repressor LexA